MIGPRLQREGFRTNPPTAEPFMVRSLRAVAAGSRYPALHGYAHMLGRRADEGELRRDLVPHSDLVRDLAPAFAQLAERIERALPLPLTPLTTGREWTRLACLLQ